MFFAKEGGRGCTRTVYGSVLRHRNAIHGITVCNCVIDRFWIDVNETNEWLGAEFDSLIHKPKTSKTMYYVCIIDNRLPRGVILF